MDPERSTSEGKRSKKNERYDEKHYDSYVRKRESRARLYKKVKRLVVTLFILLAIGVLIMSVLRIFGGGGTTNPRSDRYQAVFLDNGQVFFGKLKNTHGSYLKLENAYYSKTQELPADATAEQKAAVANNVSLVQVGKEVYGPESSLSIRAEQVLFWQNLTKDSKVSKAIESAKD